MHKVRIYLKLDSFGGIQYANNISNNISKNNHSMIPHKLSHFMPLLTVATPYSAFGRKGGVGPMIASSPALQKLFAPAAAGEAGGILDQSWLIENDGFGVWKFYFVKKTW